MGYQTPSQEEGDGEGEGEGREGIGSIRAVEGLEGRGDTVSSAVN